MFLRDNIKPSEKSSRGKMRVKDFYPFEEPMNVVGDYTREVIESEIRYVYILELLGEPKVFHYYKKDELTGEYYTIVEGEIPRDYYCWSKERLVPSQDDQIGETVEVVLVNLGLAGVPDKPSEKDHVNKKIYLAELPEEGEESDMVEIDEFLATLKSLPGDEGILYWSVVEGLAEEMGVDDWEKRLIDYMDKEKITGEIKLDSETPFEGNKYGAVRDIIKMLSDRYEHGGRTETIVSLALREGLSVEEVNEVLDKLREQGRIYEPVAGRQKTVD